MSNIIYRTRYLANIPQETKDDVENAHVPTFMAKELTDSTEQHLRSRGLMVKALLLEHNLQKDEDMPGYRNPVECAGYCGTVRIMVIGLRDKDVTTRYMEEWAAHVADHSGLTIEFSVVTAG